MLATSNEYGTGLVHRQQRFDIPSIEGAFEKKVKLLWRGCAHWWIRPRPSCRHSSGADRFGQYCGVTRVLACQTRPAAEQDTGLLQSDGVTAADLAALQDGRIDPDVGPVVLRG